MPRDFLPPFHSSNILGDFLLCGILWSIIPYLSMYAYPLVYMCYIVCIWVPISSMTGFRTLSLADMLESSHHLFGNTRFSVWLSTRDSTGTNAAKAVTKHVHKAMEINTTGGSDPLVPTSRSGIARRYSVNLRILELCIEVPPRSLTACVAHAHDEIVDTSATQYVFTVRSLNKLRNFVSNQVQ